MDHPVALSAVIDSCRGKSCEVARLRKTMEDIIVDQLPVAARLLVVNDIENELVLRMVCARFGPTSLVAKILPFGLFSELHA
ncbi:hypothetical protein ACRU43_14875 [Mycobacterium colombiense]